MFGDIVQQIKECEDFEKEDKSDEQKDEIKKKIPQQVIIHYLRKGADEAQSRRSFRSAENFLCKFRFKLLFMFDLRSQVLPPMLELGEPLPEGAVASHLVH